MTTDREQFHIERRSGIGGSDIGALVGVNSFKGEMQVYLEKVGAVAPSEPNDAMRWGTILEPVIIQEFCTQYNCKVRVGVDMVRLEGHPHIIYHADGLILDENGEVFALLEAKTSGPWGRLYFGHSGSDDVPPSYNLQVQQGMLCHDLDRAFIPVLISGQEWRVFEIERNDKLIKNMVKVADDFWPRVVERRPPDIDGTKASKEFLAALYPDDTGLTMKADSYLIEWVKRLHQARANGDAAKAAELEARNMISDKMQRAAYLEGPGFRISHKKTKDRKKTAWQAVAQALNAPKSLVAKHTTTTPGGRQFRPTWKES